MSARCRHFPALILTLGEPYSSGLAERVRGEVHSRFGAESAVLARDLGDLRRAGVCNLPGSELYPWRLDRWLRGELEQALERHDMRYPTPTPQLAVLLLAHTPAGRNLLLDAAPSVHRAIRALGLPTELPPRVTALFSIPSPEPGDEIRVAAWLHKLNGLVDRSIVDAAFVIGRANDHIGARDRLHCLRSRELDGVFAEQAVLLASTSIIEETISLRRGRRAAPWSALATKCIVRSMPHDQDADLWPWVHPSQPGWSSGALASVDWMVGAGEDAYPGARVIAGSAPSATLVRCLGAIPTDYLCGTAAWRNTDPSPESHKPAPVPTESIP